MNALLLIAAANLVTVGGHSYKVSFEEARSKTCPADSVEQASFVFLYTFAYDGGVRIANAACQADCVEAGGDDCGARCATPDASLAQRRFGQQRAFDLVREYPPSYRAAGCRELRDHCIAKCTASGAFDEERCRIDCEQHD